jgi:protein-tyrosine-phosphatase
MSTGRVLFLCSGNYYRSRMAEELFNHLARSAGSVWRAESRALRQELDGRNPGPMSVDAIKMLTQDRVEAVNGQRYPLAVKETDFLEFDRIIAMSRAEHEPMVAKDWYLYQERVGYWDVEDLHLEQLSVAYEKVKAHVSKLFDTLSGAQDR